MTATVLDLTRSPHAVFRTDFPKGLLLNDPTYRTPDELLELVRTMSMSAPADGIGRTQMR